MGDPLANGATVEIIANGSTSTDQVFTLPPGASASGSPGWKAIGSPVIGYSYKDALGTNGPVKTALMKKASNGTFLVKAVVKGSLGPISVVPPATGANGGMIFSINGGDRYCVNFGGLAGGALVNNPTSSIPPGSKVFKISSKTTAPTAESGCPVPAVTTTTVTTTIATTSVTSTTSSSSSSSTSTSSSSSTSVLVTATSTSQSSTSTSTSSTTSATSGTICGNGIREGAEECDDGNEENTDACTNACRNAVCGDGFVRAGLEQCDDGNNVPGDGCTATCVLEPPVCGNGRVEVGESCDDGNIVNGDNCPSTCVIGPCTATTTRVNVRISFARPNGVTVGALVLFLDYPDTRVSIPGSGGEPSVAARITNTPANFSSSVNDLDYALREALVASGRTLAPGAILDVGFDLCSGQTAPRRADFTCTVEQASTPQGANLPLTGITCSIQIL